MKNRQFEERLKLVHFWAITNLLEENKLATDAEAKKIRQRIMDAQIKLEKDYDKSA